MRELRFMEKPVYIPPSYQNSTVEIRTPLMNDLVQRLAGALSVNAPQIKVPPRPKGDASKNQRLSTKLERWTAAWLVQMEHQENDRIYYRFLDYLCGDGHAALKLIHRNDLWDGYPKEEDYKDSKKYMEARETYKTNARLPFSFKTLDPLTLLPRWSENGLEEILEVSKRPKIYVAKRFDISAWDNDGTPIIGRNFHIDSELSMSGECEYWEKWDTKWVEFYVNGKLVEYKEHGYKQVPYFLAQGTQTSSRDPKQEGLSVGHQLRHLLPALDSLLTMKTNAAFMTAYPAFKREREVGAPGRNQGPDPEDEDGDSSGEEFEPGHIYEGLPGERLEVIQMPPVGKDVDESISIILGIIGKVGVPSVLEGMHSPNRVSGYAYSEMLNVSRTKYTTIIRNAAFAFEQAIQFLWWLVEHRVMEEVPIWGADENGQEKWLTIGPDDINGYRAVKVVIEPLLPEDDIAQGQHAAAMVQAGMWSTRFAREAKMGIPNPEEMDDEILVEQAMKMPQVQMYLLMKALERLEMDDLAEVLGLSADMVQQQLIDAVQGNQGAPAGDPGQAGMPNMEPGTGGAGMPGVGGMMQGGQPGGPGPQSPAISPV